MRFFSVLISVACAKSLRKGMVPVNKASFAECRCADGTTTCCDDLGVQILNMPKDMKIIVEN